MTWPQQKLIERGADTLTEAELLDLITGVNGVGNLILDVFGDFRRGHSPMWSILFEMSIQTPKAPHDAKMRGRTAPGISSR